MDLDAKDYILLLGGIYLFLKGIGGIVFGV